MRCDGPLQPAASIDQLRMRKARAPRESVARTARTIRKQLYLSGRVLRLLVAASNAARRPTRRRKINERLLWKARCASSADPHSDQRSNNIIGLSQSFGRCLTAPTLNF